MTYRSSFPHATPLVAGKRFHRVLASFGIGKAADWCAPRPAQSFFAIGDIHGCFDLLQNIMHRISGVDFAAPVVCAVDVIDLGNHSEAVLRYLSAQDDGRVICLRGSHEGMILHMLDDPITAGPRWLHFGGLQALASFGISDVASTASAFLRMRDNWHRAMGVDLEHWLRTRPCVWHSRDVSVVHAGADPGLPIGQQANANLMWGHPDCPRKARQDRQWLIHGHTVVRSPICRVGQIAVDTGAYATGRLTAVHVTTCDVTFMTTGGKYRCNTRVHT
jgi:serine/threonine protein phosphatase 1